MQAVYQHKNAPAARGRGARRKPCQRVSEVTDVTVQLAYTGTDPSFPVKDCPVELFTVTAE
ncbi:hypothetical protein [Deinococcus sp.]|uniref:hypothetical protein n=1 Tax=Deinococcus sp. TaxID=47478 RepID=UPI003CC5C524